LEDLGVYGREILILIMKLPCDVVCKLDFSGPKKELYRVLVNRSLRVLYAKRISWQFKVTTNFWRRILFHGVRSF
jgi:hypothetical protein